MEKGFVSKASQFTIVVTLRSHYYCKDCEDTSQVCSNTKTPTTFKGNFFKINFIIDVVIVILTSQTPEVDLVSDETESPVSALKYQPSWVRHLRH